MLGREELRRAGWSRSCRPATASSTAWWSVAGDVVGSSFIARAPRGRAGRTGPRRGGGRSWRGSCGCRCVRAAIEIGDAAAGLLDEERGRGGVPRLQVDLEHRLRRALGDEGVAPEVAEAAIAPGGFEQRPEAGRHARTVRSRSGSCTGPGRPRGPRCREIAIRRGSRRRAAARPTLPRPASRTSARRARARRSPRPGARRRARPR